MMMSQATYMDEILWKHVGRGKNHEVNIPPQTHN